MEKKIPNLADYHVSPEWGFVLPNPLEELPEYFSCWTQLARNTEDLMKSHKLREEVMKMALLDSGQLRGHREYRLAHLLLSVIGAGYVWQEGDQNVTRVLPKCLAVPWCAVSRHLGIQPVLCHVSAALCNWKLRDATKPPHTENIQLLSAIGCAGKDGELIMQNTIAVEMAGIPAVRNLTETLHAVVAKDNERLMTSLKEIARVLSAMTQELKKANGRLSIDTVLGRAVPHVRLGMNRAMDKKRAASRVNGKDVDASLTFKNLLSVFTGWIQDRFPHKGDLVYEGVENDIALSLHTYNAAQSSILQSVEAVLGVHHPSEYASKLRIYRNYMLPAHRAFIEVLEQAPHAREYVETCDNESVKKMYNACLEALQDFRSLHIQLVTRFVVSQLNTVYPDKKDVDASNKGVMPFLKGMRDLMSDFKVKKA